MTRTLITDDQLAVLADFDKDLFEALKATLGAGAAGLETLTGAAGSIIADISKEFSLLAFTSTKAFTLPDGDRAGLVHEFICTSAGSSPVGTLTVTTPSGSQPSTHVFDTAGQSIKFLWDGSGWRVIGKRRAGGAADNVVVGTTVLTGYDLWKVYNLSIDGTKSSTSTKAIPDGLVEGEVIWVRCTTAQNTPNGSIDGTFKNLAGTAGTHLAVNATTDYEALRWDGTAWQEWITNSATIS